MAKTTKQATKTSATSTSKGRPVLVFTLHKGVFFGYVQGDTAGKKEVVLTDVKMLINFRNGRGVLQAASEGPVGNCLVSAPAPRMEINDVTAIADVSPEAAAVWDKA